MDPARATRAAGGGRQGGWLLVAAVLGLALGFGGSVMPRSEAVTEDTGIRLPPGFRIGVFAHRLAGARFMTLDPTGTVLLTVPSAGRVVALPDADGDGRADAIVTVVKGLDHPHGLAFRDGALHVAEVGRVLRFDYDAARRLASNLSVVVPDLPPGGSHWTRTIAFDRAGALLISVGSSCNVCREADGRRGAVLRHDADGRNGRIFASGLRNAVGLAVHPASGALWATVNERDWRGDDLPPDLVTEVRDGAFYGWPDCFTVAGRPRADPDSPRAECGRVTPPSVEIQAHSAPLGLAFYTGRQFPAEYHGDLFVAYHGSWNRRVPTGYKVVRVRFRDGRPEGPVEDFATGWSRDGVVIGRPVDVLVARDGALLVSDDAGGRVWRISVGGPSR